MYTNQINYGKPSASVSYEKYMDLLRRVETLEKIVIAGAEKQETQEPAPARRGRPRVENAE